MTQGGGLDTVVEHLRQSDERCPVCGYALRGVAADRCPECGARIRLRVDERGAGRWAWACAVVGSGAAWLMATGVLVRLTLEAADAVASMTSAHNAAMRRRGLLPRLEFEWAPVCATALGAAATGAAFAWAATGRGWFGRARWGRVVGIGLLGAPLALVGVLWVVARLGG